MNEPTYPTQPLQRFLDLARAIAGHRSWHEDWTILRYAAMALVTSSDAPETAVQRLWDVADELKANTKWYSPLRSNVRFAIAAILASRGERGVDFAREYDSMIALFKKHKLPTTAPTYAAIAALILRGASLTRRVESGQVQRVADLYRAFRADHPFLTGSDDLPACAFLTTSGDSPSDVAQRVESLYKGLGQIKFARGGQRQLAAQILCMAPVADDVALRRFGELWTSFKQAGLYMHSGDFDELAILSCLSQATDQVVRKVLEHRDAIRELKPRPSKDTAFSLATSTAFIALAPGSGSLDEARILLQIQSVLQAQQAALAASAAAAAAAGAG